MNALQYLWLWLFILPHRVFALGVGTSLSQYKGTDPTRPGVCSTGFAPAWMCGISGVAGAKSLLEKVTGFILGIAAGVGVCVFIYACIQIVMSQGQDDKTAAAKKMAIIALVGVFLALSARVIIGALWSEVAMGPQTPSLLRTILGLPP